MNNRFCLVATLALGVAAVVGAQSTVYLPEEGQTSTANAAVTEQARVSVPPSILFDVVDISEPTESSPVSVLVDHIVLASASRMLQISVRADASSFQAPYGGTPTWSAGDITWGEASWVNGEGYAGTMSDSAFNVLAMCDPGVSECNTADLVFELAPNLTVQRAGGHALSVTWKFEGVSLAP